MPGSHSQQINEVVEILVLLKPGSLLDVGVGFGKYGVLAREYLDLWEGHGKDKSQYGSWERRVDGVEAYQEYLTPVHQFIYDQIYVGDARTVVPGLHRHYELALLIDIIEHLNHTDGLALLQTLRRISRNVLISTPKNMGQQGALYGNCFEEHIAQWSEAHFAEFKDKVFIPNEASLICFFGEDFEKVSVLLRRKKWRQFRQSLKTLFPFLAYPYHRLKMMGWLKK